MHEEFTDILNFMILFAEECNIDIEKVMIEKLEKNAKKYPVEKSKWNSTKYDKL